MYEDFYGFREKPFQIIPNADYLYRSLKHDKALTYLEYGLKENLGFILLTGEIGSGKTTLIQYILGQLDEDVEAGVIFNTNVTTDQLLSMILTEFEVPPRDNKADRIDALNEYLIQLYSKKRKALLIIDEAQNLSKEALEEVRMLSNLQSDDQGLLQIMLVGQPELKKKLNDPDLRQFAQRIGVSYHLTGLDLDETGKYIAHRLQKAGGAPDLFTPTAVEQIFKLSGGIPRSINITCQAALVYGFADGSRMITQDIIRELKQDEVGISLDRTIVVPEAVEKTDIKDQAQASNEYDHRIKTLEDELNNLKKLVGERIRELESNALNSKDELVKHLTAMLKEERKRNDEILSQLHDLEQKYAASKRAHMKLHDNTKR